MIARAEHIKVLLQLWKSFGRHFDGPVIGSRHAVGCGRGKRSEFHVSGADTQ